MKKAYEFVNVLENVEKSLENRVYFPKTLNYSQDSKTTQRRLNSYDFQNELWQAEHILEECFERCTSFKAYEMFEQHFKKAEASEMLIDGKYVKMARIERFPLPEAFILLWVAPMKAIEP